MHGPRNILMNMSVTSDLVPPTGPGAWRRAVGRTRRFRAQRTPAANTAPDSATARPSTVGTVVLGGVAVVLTLLATAFVATGVVVLVDNGAAEWMAAAVPAVLAGALFFLAAKFGRALIGAGNDDTPRH